VNPYVPSPRYRTKLYATLTCIALSFQAGALVFAMLLSLDRDTGIGAGVLVFLLTAALNCLWWVPAMVWSGFYQRSLSYEIRDNEIIVRQGVLTRAVKHVPYRTVTNITVRRGLIDRWLGIGTLEIQTAGISGTHQAEQTLVGLVDVDELYDLVVARLHRFRGGMSPTQAEAEAPHSTDDTLVALLAEVRAIRRALEERN
jgi:membrane protein YdbS with pleckstrin-like domain